VLHTVGVRAALNVLKGRTGSNHILVVSDGDETDAPFIDDVRQEVNELILIQHIFVQDIVFHYRL
jgi:hypothetical protein